MAISDFSLLVDMQHFALHDKPFKWLFIQCFLVLIQSLLVYLLFVVWIKKFTCNGRGLYTLRPRRVKQAIQISACNMISKTNLPIQRQVLSC